MGRGAKSPVLSKSAYLAFLRIRKYIDSHGTLTGSEAAQNLRDSSYDIAGLDLNRGELLYNCLPKDFDWDESESALRYFIESVTYVTKPHWIYAFAKGRGFLSSLLTDEARQVFRDAGLFDAIPHEDTLKWWDRMATRFRSERDLEHLEIGRIGERLTIEHEQQQLKEQNIDAEPEWVALDNNSYGYDVLSYRRIAGVIHPKLIEVKATTTRSIFFTRNEWENAASAGSSYEVHVWYLPSKTLTSIPVDTLCQHIPTDHGDGMWETVSIRV